MNFYSKQNDLIKFLINVGFFALIYIFFYRLLFATVPYWHEAINNIRSEHINSILYCSHKLLYILGVDTVLDTDKHRLITESHRWVTMGPLCSGVKITSALVIFILSFPGRSFLYRLLFASFGTVIIYILNVIRIAIIAIQIGSDNISHVRFVHNYHEIVYDSFIYILVLLYIGFYILKLSTSTIVTNENN